MVTITDDAAQLLSRIQRSLESNSTLGVVVEEGEAVIGRSEAAPDDEVYFHGGSRSCLPAPVRNSTDVFPGNRRSSE
jgi:hypothetical protein